MGNTNQLVNHVEQNYSRNRTLMPFYGVGVPFSTPNIEGMSFKPQTDAYMLFSKQKNSVIKT